jgi:hypothetical protein
MHNALCTFQKFLALKYLLQIQTRTCGKLFQATSSKCPLDVTVAIHLIHVCICTDMKKARKSKESSRYSTIHRSVLKASDMTAPLSNIDTASQNHSLPAACAPPRGVQCIQKLHTPPHQNQASSWTSHQLSCS